MLSVSQMFSHQPPRTHNHLEEADHLDRWLYTRAFLFPKTPVRSFEGWGALYAQLHPPISQRHETRSILGASVCAHVRVRPESCRLEDVPVTVKVLSREL